MNEKPWLTEAPRNFIRTKTNFMWFPQNTTQYVISIDTWNTRNKLKRLLKDNQFYLSIGPKLVSKIPGSDISPTSCIANSNPEIICFIPVSQYEVSKIIFGLKYSSAGWYTIYSKIVKHTYHYILPVLTHLFNFSITKKLKNWKSCPNLQKWKLHVG